MQKANIVYSGMKDFTRESYIEMICHPVDLSNIRKRRHFKQYLKMNFAYPARYAARSESWCNPFLVGGTGSIVLDFLVKRYFLHSFMSVKDLDRSYRKITTRCKCARSSSLIFSSLSDSG